MGTSDIFSFLSCLLLLLLLGTLLQNRYDELWCLLDWANPGSVGSLSNFTARFTTPIEKGLRVNALKGELAKARHKLGQLEELKDGVVLRRTKDKTISGT